jgi:hypothetical protein
MISPISSATPNQAATQAPPVQQAQPKSPAQPSASDTVQISNAAKALSQENLETPAQTSKEASGGDIQAIRLLARHAAARASAK